MTGLPGLCVSPTLKTAEQNWATALKCFLRILHWHQLMVTLKGYYKPLLPPPFASHSAWGTLEWFYFSVSLCCSTKPWGGFVFPFLFAVVPSLGLNIYSE